MQNLGGSTFASMLNPTLVAGSVKGTGKLAPVFNDSQETPKKSNDPAVSVKSNVLIPQNYIRLLMNQE